jgi:hypothetical protein
MTTTPAPNVAQEYPNVFSAELHPDVLQLWVNGTEFNYSLEEIWNAMNPIAAAQPAPEALAEAVDAHIKADYASKLPEHFQRCGGLIEALKQYRAAKQPAQRGEGGK